MTVRNWLSTNYEKLQFITPDGEIYNLHDPSKKAVVSTTGWGLPAANIATTLGPFQHGTNPLTIRIPPREIRVTIRYNGCSRREYWSGRMGLIDALRLNRTNLNNPTSGKLRWYRADGRKFQADVMVSSGPNFNPSTGWDSFGYTDEIEFIAHNPILYDPRQYTETFTGLGCEVGVELTFPFFFGSDNVVFGGDRCNNTANTFINYQGNWQEYPLITVIGPATNFMITHVQTGLKLELENYVIPTDDSVIFDLRYNKKTIVLQSSGESVLGYLSTDSDLGTFAIEPDPVVDGGVNAFEVSVQSGSDTNTQVIFQYYNRYIGM